MVWATRATKVPWGSLWVIGSSGVNAFRLSNFGFRVEQQLAEVARLLIGPVVGEGRIHEPRSRGGGDVVIKPTSRLHSDQDGAFTGNSSLQMRNLA